MKVIKQGETFLFSCGSCGCEFVEGVNALVNCGFFFRTYCPMCGTECKCKTDTVDGSIPEE